MTPGARFRQLIARGEFPLVPGCHDGIGARLIETTGFPAGYMSGFCLAASMGKPDVGILTMTDVVARSAIVAASVDIPILADADTGYGGPLNIRETVREMERAGIAGIHLEDQKMPKRCGALAGKELVSDEEMASRIRIARESRRSDDFYIIARTDAVTIHGVAEAARRCKEMERAGADMVMVPSLATPSDLATIATCVSIPVMYVAAETIRPMYSRDQLREFGFAMALYPLSLIMASAAVQMRLLTQLLGSGTTQDGIAAMMPFAEVGDLFGVTEATAFEAGVAS